MPSDKALGFLGVLQNGKRLAIGESAAGARNLGLLLIASDASDRAKKEAYAIAAKGDTKTLEAYSKAELGAAIGKGLTAYIGIKGEKEATAFLSKRHSKEER